MAFTVRLGPKAERTLNSLAKRKRLSRSEVVREALARLGDDDNAGDDAGRPYEAWLDVIGVVNLGVRDTARTTGEQFAGMVRDHARARRPR